MQTLKQKIEKISSQARKASFKLALVKTSTKNKVLIEMAHGLKKRRAVIIEANKKDIVNARKKKMPEVFIERLALNEKRIEQMSKSLLQVAKLRDPVG